MVTISPIMNLMLRIVNKAAKGLIRDFYEVESLQVSQKGPGNFVSMADKRTEDFIRTELIAARPDYSFLLEEGGEIIGKNKEYRFIIDPLDGTNNFLHSLPYFCITVALERVYPDNSCEIIAAVTYAPILQELYWAEKGQGVWFESSGAKAQRLRVAKRKELATSLICVGSLRHDLDIISKVGKEVCAVRCMGSTALAMAHVAAGKFDGFMHSKALPWDIAAGILFILEAGGDVSDLDGGNAMFSKESIVASNSTIKDLLLKKL